MPQIEISEQFGKTLTLLRPFVIKSATLKNPTKNSYSSCLRASFVKVFEFVDFAWKQQPEYAFSLTSTLRGIAEDLIFLRYLSMHKRKKREQVVFDLLYLSAIEGMENQHAFFKTFRPFQVVLFGSFSSANKQKTYNRLNSFWRECGWRKLSHRLKVPPTRQLAERIDQGILKVVYDFIYRLTSNTVHFNPLILLRSGWGSDLKEMTFSPKNMGRYYLAVSQIYGTYLLCLYFEMFGRYLRTNRDEKTAVSKLRELLLHIDRWPEMVTFEEMNQPIPTPPLLSSAFLHARYTQIMVDKGFVQGSKHILSMASGIKPQSSSRPSN